MLLVETTATLVKLNNGFSEATKYFFLYIYIAYVHRNFTNPKYTMKGKRKFSTALSSTPTPLHLSFSLVVYFPISLSLGVLLSFELLCAILLPVAGRLEGTHATNTALLF